ncbi:recombinase family protein [Methylorubrum extorquens]
MKPPVRTLRCAIYTRVSTEHGLEQEFNSLDNQREAAEAYIKSQAHEGWRCLPTRYDDGGYSGGSLDRPALQRLLVEIQARRIDVVVVYKVDRLTRALSDFAKLVELFDAHGVSFVSVTQAFNTTTSMGRLTLNVLLSFAQFEREVTGERIRDKIAASKQKGIWMGGVVPLGYRVEARALHVVDEHAALIRTIFARYLELGAVSAVQAELQQAGTLILQRIDGQGRVTGGSAFSRGHLYAILRNPLYVGQLTHKDRVYEGQHPGIIDPAVFKAVQAQLAQNRHHRTARQLQSEHLLAGRIRDDRGGLMTPTYTSKGSRRYRYYVSQAVLQGREPGAIRRVVAPAIEALVVEALRSAMPDAAALGDAELIARALTCVHVHAGVLHLVLAGEAERRIEVAWSPPANRRQREIIQPPGAGYQQVRPMKVEDRARILRAIAAGRRWVDDLVTSRVTSPEAIAAREGCSERSVRMTLALAHLSPVIVQAIVDGRLPRGIGIRNLVALPAAWGEQEQALGL